MRSNCYGYECDITVLCDCVRFPSLAQLKILPHLVSYPKVELLKQIVRERWIPIAVGVLRFVF
jgi:hypothetical protein